jgi:hypothetical protein
MQMSSHVYEELKESVATFRNHPVGSPNPL